ncbi:unnamed protein product [Paramecium sonneborni]|uniref:Uncharacterized protein n=1 Tax=Paramecium sonneborni TaxID=65129 RepID=A0A8S1RT69_9CILI|nr:unnamed protein product [Paramecium sonneborni]
MNNLDQMFCIDTLCPNQRPYCHFCLPSHVQHLNKLTSQELLSDWINARVHNVQNIQNHFQECKISLDRLINVFLPYNNFNTQQFSEQGLLQIDQLIKGFCQMEDGEEKLFKQFKQWIVSEILKIKKNQTNQKSNDDLQIPLCDINKQILEQQQPL